MSRNRAKPRTRWPRCATAKGAPPAHRAIVNVRESSIAREAETVWPTYAGPEIGVASTKAFTCQLAVAGGAGHRGGARARPHRCGGRAALVRALAGDAAPHGRRAVASREDRSARNDIAKAQDVLYLGRGVHFPLALEGALKLKEISYIHAEGYAAGEMKHGPIALIDQNVR